MAAKTASLSVNIIADAAKARSGLKEAETAFGKFSREVGNAQGAMGKFQAIGNSAFAAVKANAVGFATAAATAIGAFVVKSVSDFQNLVLSIGKFSDATGLSMDQASRLVEVAGDIGIEMATVEKSIGFMNKTLGNNAEAFKEMGVQIAYSNTGAVDANQTFLNVVDYLNRIQDPAAKASAGATLLGRGWQQMAELIGMGSKELSQSLKEVEDSKVFNDEQRQNAEDLRDAFDTLKGKVEGFANSIGDTLVPVLTDAIESANAFFEVFKIDLPIIGNFGDRVKDVLEWSVLKPLKLGKIGLDLLTSAFGDNGDAVGDYAVVTDKMTEAWIGGYQAMIDARTESDGLAASLRNQAEDVDIARLKWDEFRNGLNIEAQSLRLTGNIEDFRKKWADTTDEAKLKSREYQQELLRIQIELGNAALSIVGLATTAQNNRIRLLIETGQLERAKSLIDAIAAGMNMLAGAVTPDRVERILGQAPSGGAGTGKAPPPAKKTEKPVGQRLEYLSPLQQLDKIRTQRLAAMAAGGTVVGSGMALVGEQGPELVNMPRGASVIPSIPSKRMLGSGQMTVNISVQAGLVSSPDQVGAQIIEAIRRAERRSGQVFAAA
jgi:hypothetical protein